MELRCDLKLNCDDGSDEMNCNDSRFACESGTPVYVNESQVCWR